MIYVWFKIRKKEIYLRVFLSLFVFFLLNFDCNFEMKDFCQDKMVEKGFDYEKSYFVCIYGFVILVVI